MAESTLLFNKTPYENDIVLGHVQDVNGQKMSKSEGNAVDPFDALESYGADAIRDVYKRQGFHQSRRHLFTSVRLCLQQKLHSAYIWHLLISL